MKLHKLNKLIGMLLMLLVLFGGNFADARGFGGGFRGGGFRGFSRGSSWGRRSSSRRSSSWGRRSRSSRRSSSRSRARKSTSLASKKMSPKQRRALRVKNRTYKRKLKANQRKTVRQNRVASRNTYNDRYAGRATTNFVYMPGYSAYSLTRSMLFANLYMGIYFHDPYRHGLHRSWLWYHHHRDYDTSHWDAKKQAELEKWRAYYENQGVGQEKNYADPGTNRDTDYIKDYVGKNPDQFYGAKASEVTVEELPDESGAPPGFTQHAEKQYNVSVEHSTSGGTWFLLIFGVICVVGIVALKFYNQGYF